MIINSENVDKHVLLLSLLLLVLSLSVVHVQDF